MRQSKPYEILRLYNRQFKSDKDREAFITSVDKLEIKLSAADVSFRLFQSEASPLSLTEMWFYPNEDTMVWVRQIVDGNAPLLTQFNLTSQSDTLFLRRAFDIHEED